MRNQAPFSIFAATILVLLSGCVASEAKDEAVASQAPIPSAAEPASFDETTGAVAGLVTDDELQPIGGAQVGLLELPERTTVSDVAGAFSFSNLPPAKYQVLANALGFTAQGRIVEVVAGQATQVQFALSPLPIAVAYAELRLFNGYISCAFSVVRTTLPTNCPVVTAGTTKNWHELYPGGFPTDWMGTLVEADWNSQAQPDWLAFDYNDRDLKPDSYFGVYKRVRGTSPIHFFVERCGDYRATDYGRGIVPCTDEQVNASHMHVETFYDGKFQQETHVGDPICSQNVTNPTGGNALPGYQAGCYGVGPALDIRWTNYVTLFHLELPADVNTYSARPDK